MNRYAFTDEKTALNLLGKLGDYSKGYTDYTHAIVVLGFQDKYDIDADGNQILIKKATSFDVDVIWKGTQPKEWEAYEVIPATPNHTFS